MASISKEPNGRRTIQESIAAKHYLQVTDEHYTQAVQNPVQQPSDNAGNLLKPARVSRDFQHL
ncbi:MAG: hypothetical protein WCJ35_14700 [Planctomycetota bacterium]